eukprot:CAMPEP_0180558992 /NCGR_PEP_ID=MMETSP1037_2-20121125/2053_1 /TAXON_ID=632150 /ORGANISM="Azadinium spinosum, Strain 3D9" /LENGTH=87 /DNA_ID=CAMNT_0022575423 /DNA_START=127 /DNA_END=388 /DNA_ORIENTATION=+
MQQPPRTIGQEKSAAISAALAHEQLTRERGAETVEVHDLLPALSAKSFLQPDILFRDAAQPLPIATDSSAATSVVVASGASASGAVS